jgi:hypothetical protein
VRSRPPPQGRKRCSEPRKGAAPRPTWRSQGPRKDMKRETMTKSYTAKYKTTRSYCRTHLPQPVGILGTSLSKDATKVLPNRSRRCDQAPKLTSVRAIPNTFDDAQAATHQYICLLESEWKKNQARFSAAGSSTSLPHAVGKQLRAQSARFWRADSGAGAARAAAKRRAKTRVLSLENMWMWWVRLFWY